MWCFVFSAHRGYICTLKRQTMIEVTVITGCDHVTSVGSCSMFESIGRQDGCAEWR